MMIPIRPRTIALRQVAGTALACLAWQVTAATFGATADKLELRPATPGPVGRYAKIEFNLEWSRQYSNPYDPDEVEVALEIKAPSGSTLLVPAFFHQPYEWLAVDRGGRKAEWFYPTGQPGWSARFAPAEVGPYSATAVVKDHAGLTRSKTIAFDSRPAPGKGFIRVSRDDPRFFEHEDGSPFFPIGQNVAFIGESQHLDTGKAATVFEKMAANGANFARVWACAEDWGMAIEARKSAWGRSWSWKPSFVPWPDQPGLTNRLCIGLGGSKPTTVTLSPSHLLGLKPGLAYVLTGSLITEPGASLVVDLPLGPAPAALRSDSPLKWKAFSHTFTNGAGQRWLGDGRFRAVGEGRVWLRDLSLREAGGGPELLWEADPNRPSRGVYNQLDSFMLDRIVDSAGRHGVYLQLCLLTRDLYRPALGDPQSAAYQAAVTDAKKFFRYAVARWGYSTHVAAWEYFNENDPNLPSERFHRELGKYLERADPYHHLRTTSGWGPAPRHWSHPQLDIADLHWYLRPVSKPDWRDEVAAIIDRAALLRSYATNKPALLGEFGLADDKWGRSPYMPRDRQGVHFHNALWASAFSGLSGTASFWWWETLDQNDLYHHYRPLADFLAGVPFTRAHFQAVVLTTQKQSRVLAWRGRAQACFWLHNPQATWWNRVAEDKTVPVLREDSLLLTGLADGHYRLEWWDPQTGKVVSTRTVSSAAPGLRLELPPYASDLAGKLVRQ
jgi:hypothetical protein